MLDLGFAVLLFVFLTRLFSTAVFGVLGFGSRVAGS